MFGIRHKKSGWGNAGGMGRAGSIALILALMLSLSLVATSCGGSGGISQPELEGQFENGSDKSLPVEKEVVTAPDEESTSAPGEDGYAEADSAEENTAQGTAPAAETTTLDPDKESCEEAARAWFSQYHPGVDFTVTVLDNPGYGNASIDESSGGWRYIGDFGTYYAVVQISAPVAGGQYEMVKSDGKWGVIEPEGSG